MAAPHEAPPRAPIYLDYNATTPVLGTVATAMSPFISGELISSAFGNPSSGTVHGARAKAAVEEAREHT